jgi:hypothetical protein
MTLRKQSLALATAAAALAGASAVESAAQARSGSNVPTEPPIVAVPLAAQHNRSDVNRRTSPDTRLILRARGSPNPGGALAFIDSATRTSSPYRPDDALTPVSDLARAGQGRFARGIGGTGRDFGAPAASRRAMAADILETSNTRAYLRAAAGTRRLWGLRNYQDVNRSGGMLNRGGVNPRGGAPAMRSTRGMRGRR